jgi:esterase/lipase
MAGRSVLDDIAVVTDTFPLGWLEMSVSKGGTGKSGPNPFDNRLQPTGLNSSFIDSHLTFPEYISHSRELIKRTRSDDQKINLDKIVEGNAPFELRPADGYLPGKEKPYRRGIVLTHGLSDSPYFMRHLAKFFQENGFRVMGVLLPGHGTQPGDLLHLNWQEWHKAVEFGVNRLADEVDEVYLGGYSAGGALSVYQSLIDSRGRGLFLFAPALKVSDKAAFANFHKVYSWYSPSAKWLSVNPDTDIYKYESFPKNAAAQMHALTKVIKSRLNKCKVKIPIFAVASQDDTTVDTSATVDLIARAENPANKLVYYYSDPEKIPSGPVQEKIECVNSVISEQKIISSAHTAIVLPREDEYYGEAAKYCNCLHYYPGDMKKYQICREQTDAIMQGEITEKNLECKTLRRLMYNPHFEALKIQMKNFIDKLPGDILLVSTVKNSMGG